MHMHVYAYWGYKWVKILCICPKCEFKNKLNSLSAEIIATVSANSWKLLIVQRIAHEIYALCNCPSVSSMSSALVIKTVAGVLLIQPEYHSEWPFYYEVKI